MASRLKLHEEFCNILNNRNVYFQPPENFKLTYPCIIYEKRPPYTARSDDGIHFLYDSYEISLIYLDPDSELPKKVLTNFRLCSHNRHFINDNLYHDSFTLYY